MIKSKKKCVDDCLKDNDFKFQYKGECLEECPENTLVINNDYICKENIDEDKCIVTKKEFSHSNLNDGDFVQSLVKRYVSESININNYILQYSNDNYNLLIFKNSTCVNELNIRISEIDFGKCYTSIQSNLNIEEDL